VRPGTDLDRRARVLREWSRAEMKRLVPELLARWTKLNQGTLADEVWRE